MTAKNSAAIVASIQNAYRKLPFIVFFRKYRHLA